MTQYSFGVGTVIGKRVDQTGTQTAFFGTTQDWEINLDQKLETLMGQYKDPVDVAPSSRAITGKIKFARLQATTIGNMLLGVTPTAASGIDVVGPESHTPVSTTFTVNNGGAFTEDLGLFYHASGVALVPVAATPALGQYIPGLAGTGTYTINATDEVALDVYYLRTTTDQFQMDVTQSLMGSGPVVELTFSNPYSVQGVVKKLNIQLPAARMGKMPMQFKNANYMIPEMDFTAFLSAAGKIMTMSLTE